MIECSICKKMIAKLIFEKHYELCNEAKKKECYYKYQQELITGKMNDVLSQSHSKAGKEIYLQKMQTKLDKINTSQRSDSRADSNLPQKPKPRARRSVQSMPFVRPTTTAETDDDVTSAKSLTFQEHMNKPNRVSEKPDLKNKKKFDF